MAIKWEQVAPWDMDWESTECECDDQTKCLLDVEEGVATLTHEGCGKPLWIEQHDIWAEFPVTVKVETCSNPGGWHGMERCDCGPTITIEHDPTRTA